MFFRNYLLNKIEVYETVDRKIKPGTGTHSRRFSYQYYHHGYFIVPCFYGYKFLFNGDELLIAVAFS